MYGNLAGCTMIFHDSIAGSNMQREICHRNAWQQGGRRRSLLSLLFVTALVWPGVVHADPVAVRHREGTVHGFLVLHTMKGNTLAAGDLTQVIQGDRIVSELIFHFKDGSVDKETTIFSQNRTFRLLSDHHVQKGPSFPHPMDVSINTSTGRVRVHFSNGGKEKVETHHLDLPVDLANGLLFTILKNIRPDVKETKVSYLAATPELRLVKLAIRPQGEDAFWVAGARHKATQYVLKIELGGLTGAFAALLGKQPKDIRVWILESKAPAFVRMEGQFYQGGPVWKLELAAPVWQPSQSSTSKGASP